MSGIISSEINRASPVFGSKKRDFPGWRSSGIFAVCWEIAKIAISILSLQSLIKQGVKKSSASKGMCFLGDSPVIAMSPPYGLTPHSRVNAVMQELNYGIRESMGLPVPKYYQMPQDQCYDIGAREEELQEHMRYILPEEMSESFGNKHINLVKMHKLVKTLDRSDDFSELLQ